MHTGHPKGKWKSLSRVWLSATPGLYNPWNSPGQDTGVGSHSLLQGQSLPTQGGTQVSRIAGGFFTSWAREAQGVQGGLCNDFLLCTLWSPASWDFLCYLPAALEPQTPSSDTFSNASKGFCLSISHSDSEKTGMCPQEKKHGVSTT